MQAMLVLIVYIIFYSFIISLNFVLSFYSASRTTYITKFDIGRNSNKRLTLKFIIIFNNFMFTLTHHDCPGKGWFVVSEVPADFHYVLRYTVL